jgi:hypothetical protein
MLVASEVAAVPAGPWSRSASALRRGQPKLEPVHILHPERSACEEFIAARFQRAHGARIGHFSPHLLGVRDALGRWRAASGYTPAGGRRLFLEQYLDAPAEHVLAQHRGRAIDRDGIVEVGNLAASSMGMARTLIPLLARHLERLGYDWVVFTATRELRNTFARLGLRPVALAPADPARLRERGVDWGRYYDNDPVVMAGRISHGVRAAVA